MNDIQLPLIPNIEGTEYMGESIRSKLMFCGEGVRLYPLCKMIRADRAMLDTRCQLFDNVFVDAGRLLQIGKYSTLTWFVLIEGGAKTTIGDRVFVGPGSKILTSTYELDGYYSVEHLPDACRATIYGDITIEDDAYIGANCTIMPGSIIHEGAVVGANSFVKGELDPWTVYVGSPCRAVSKREPPTEERRQKLMETIDWSNHL